MPRLPAESAPARRIAPVLQWVQIACVAWVLWLPVSHGVILYPALAGVLVTSAALIVLDRLPVPVEVRWMAVVYFAMVVVLVATSYARANPGATHQSALWVGVPLIWGSWALTLSGTHLRRTVYLLVVMTVVTGLTVTWLAIQALGRFEILPTWFLELQQVTFSVSDYSQIEMRYQGLSSLVGLSVLSLALACLPGRLEQLPPMWLTRSAAVLGFVAAVVSGRRGLTVVAVLAPIVCVAWACLLLLRRRWEGDPPRTYWRDVAVGVVAVAVLTLSPLGINLTSMVGVPGVVNWPVASGYAVYVPGQGSTPLEPSGDSDSDGQVDAGEDSVRVDQVSEMVTYWREAPVVGQGLGAVLPSGYQRDPERPWMFENQPVQVLMNIGIAGVAVLLALVVLLLRLARRAWATGRLHRLTVASGVTLVLMLVADMTNPYLAAPGHGWAVFVLLGVCVAALRDGIRDTPEVEQRAFSADG